MTEVKIAISDHLADLRQEFVTEADDFEQEFKTFHQEQMHKAERRGKSDGRKNLPSSKANKPTVFERSILQAYERQMSELAIDFEGFLHRVKAFIQKLSKQLSDITEDDLDDDIKLARKQKEEELARLEDKYREDIALIEQDPEREHWQHLYQEADDQFEDLEEELGRSFPNELVSISPVWYWVIIVVLGLSEVAAYHGVFLNFDEPQLTTWIWAIGFGLAVSFLGHFVGVILAKGREKLNYLIIGGILLVGLMYGFWNLAKFRMRVLPEEFSFKYITDSAFMVISMVFLAVSVLLSFLSHDSNLQFYKIYKKREKLQAKVAAAKKRIWEKKKAQKEVFKQQMNEIEKRFQDRIEQIKGRPAAFKSILIDATNLYDEMLIGCRNLEKFIASSGREAVAKYRESNAKQRHDDEPLLWQHQYSFSKKFAHMPELNPNKRDRGLWRYDPN